MTIGHDEYRALHAIPADHKIISAYVHKETYAKLQAQAKAKGVSVSVLAGQLIAAHLGDPEA